MKPFDGADPFEPPLPALRTGMTRGHGGQSAYIHEARVVDVNYINWTVDVVTQFDSRFYNDIQIASPYMHLNRGEGIYVMPEVNAKCLVCIPSDGPPPFVLAFIMPMEEKDQPEEDDTDSEGGMGPATFAGGRTRGKPGDIVLKGRDGNFMVLHRGGVLQIGATELAQRIYIPMHNIVTDVSQNYAHQNTGGAINWGVSSSSTDENPETEFSQTFRLFANDEKADIKVAMGKVHQPVLEPPDESGEFAGLNELEIGTTQPVCLECIIAPGGFNAENGTPDPSAIMGTKMKFFFDRGGGGFLRAEGSVLIRVKKKLRIISDEDMHLKTLGFLTLESEKMIRLRSKAGLQIGGDGGVIALNGGENPVATVGSTVAIAIPAVPPIFVIPVPPGTPGQPPGALGILWPTELNPLSTFTGVIRTGNPTVLA